MRRPQGWLQPCLLCVRCSLQGSGSALSPEPPPPAACACSPTPSSASAFRVPRLSLSNTLQLHSGRSAPRSLCPRRPPSSCDRLRGLE